MDCRVVGTARSWYTVSNVKKILDYIKEPDVTSVYHRNNAPSLNSNNAVSEINSEKMNNINQ